MPGSMVAKAIGFMMVSCLIATAIFRVNSLQYVNMLEGFQHTRTMLLKSKNPSSTLEFVTVIAL
jgi:hypothetical protein